MAQAAGHGVPADPVAALGWFRRAAERGHIDPQFELGRRLMDGRRVARDADEALAWLSRATRFHVGGMLRLAEAHERGEGTRQDLRQARELYRHAALLGSAEGAAAARRLAMLP